MITNMKNKQLRPPTPAFLLKRQIKRLVKAKQWDNALNAVLLLLDEQHDRCTYLHDILWAVKLDPNKLRTANTGSSWNLLGYLYKWGIGVRRDAFAEYDCVCRAVELGHAHAMWRKGYMLETGHGVQRNPHEGAQWFRISAEAGCSAACVPTGGAYEYGIYGVEINYLEAARWYAKSQEDGAKVHLKFLLQRYPMRCCPWGQWKPDPIMHQLVPLPVALAQHTTLLVCKRHRVDKNVALIIVGYVCTRGIQWGPDSKIS